MSLDFKNISKIEIPSGEVTKIVRKSDDTILWQKEGGTLLIDESGNYANNFVFYKGTNSCLGIYRGRTVGTKTVLRLTAFGTGDQFIDFDFANMGITLPLNGKKIKFNFLNIDKASGTSAGVTLMKFATITDLLHTRGNNFYNYTPKSGDNSGLEITIPDGAYGVRIELSLQRDLSTQLYFANMNNVVLI